MIKHKHNYNAHYTEYIYNDKIILKHYRNENIDKN